MIPWGTSLAHSVKVFGEQKDFDHTRRIFGLFVRWKFFGIRVIDVVNLFFKWKMPLLTLEEHNFDKSERNWMIQKLNKVSIEGLQIIFTLYHQLSDN
jgi:hypothetical protein